MKTEEFQNFLGINEDGHFDKKVFSFFSIKESWIVACIVGVIAALLFSLTCFFPLLGLIASGFGLVFMFYVMHVVLQKKQWQNMRGCAFIITILFLVFASSWTQYEQTDGREYFVGRYDHCFATKGDAENYFSLTKNKHIKLASGKDLFEESLDVFCNGKKLKGN